MDAQSLSAAIRKKKKQMGQADYRQDMDYAGQDAVDPNVALDAKHNMEVSDVLGDPDHDSPSASAMGEDESTQKLSDRKKISARINRYFDEMTIKK